MQERSMKKQQLAAQVMGVPASIEFEGKRIQESSSLTACRFFRRQRVVRFSPDTTRVHRVSRLQDLSVQEINETWYSKAEYMEIREDIESAIKLNGAGLTDPEQVRFFYRGCESKTSERSMQRLHNIDQSVQSVMLEQKRMQLLKGSAPDPRVIANKYSVISTMCQNDAHLVGLWDAKCVERLWWIRRDELPRMPRRVKSVAGEENRPSIQLFRAVLTDPKVIVNGYGAISMHFQYDALRVRADELPRMPRRKLAMSA
jgi:hypothetical protein